MLHEPEVNVFVNGALHFHSNIRFVMLRREKSFINEWMEEKFSPTVDHQLLNKFLQEVNAIIKKFP